MVGRNAVGCVRVPKRLRQERIGRTIIKVRTGFGMERPSTSGRHDSHRIDRFPGIFGVDRRGPGPPGAALPSTLLGEELNRDNDADYKIL